MPNAGPGKSNLPLVSAFEIKVGLQLGCLITFPLGLSRTAAAPFFLIESLYLASYLVDEFRRKDVQECRVHRGFSQ